MNQKEKFRNITIALPEIYCDNLEKLKKMGYIKNRSEGIRLALDDFIHKEVKYAKKLGYPLEDNYNKNIKETKIKKL
ncbi:MAG: ribbon-helix-helix domain-containing protein [Promethearchaeota archaeon]